MSSDPFVSSLRNLPAKKLKALPTETIELLMAPKLEISYSAKICVGDSDDESDAIVNKNVKKLIIPRETYPTNNVNEKKKFFVKKYAIFGRQLVC